MSNINLFPGDLCQNDIDLLASWSQDVTFDQAGDLMGSGYVEMEEMGRRYRARLPELFQDPYDPDQVTVSFGIHWKTLVSNSKK